MVTVNRTFTLPIRPGGPRTLDDAVAYFDGLRERQPGLFADAPPKGWARGIDALQGDNKIKSQLAALALFYFHHERLPDLETYPLSSDYWFRTKFFDPIPMPTPASKLNVGHYIEPETLARIGEPARPWVSTDPYLPHDEAVPPGKYFFKYSNGNAMQTRVSWPPSMEERDALTRQGAQWRNHHYGLVSGEWWYLTEPGKFFLEEDLTDRMEGRPEAMIFCRRGRPSIISLRIQGPEPKQQRFYDAAFNPLEGVSRPWRTPADIPLPEKIDLMLEAAAEAARPFRAVRVDFLNAAGEKPMVGEITVCHQSANTHFYPLEFDWWFKETLFGSGRPFSPERHGEQDR